MVSNPYILQRLKLKVTVLSEWLICVPLHTSAAHCPVSVTLTEARNTSSAVQLNHNGRIKNFLNLLLFF